MNQLRSLFVMLIASMASEGLAATPTAAPVKPVSRAALQKPLTIMEIGALDFGTVVAGSLSGAIAIHPVSGARTLTGGVTAGPSNNEQRATFKVTGAPQQSLVLILTSPSALTNAEGATVPVLALTLDGSPVRSLPSSGALNFGIGGVIAVGADQEEGVYSANYDVTASYL